MTEDQSCVRLRYCEKNWTRLGSNQRTGYCLERQRFKPFHESYGIPNAGTSNSTV